MTNQMKQMGHIASAGQARIVGLCLPEIWAKLILFFKIYISRGIIDVLSNYLFSSLYSYKAYFGLSVGISKLKIAFLAKVM
jgi:hypothetical protein